MKKTLTTLAMLAAAFVATAQGHTTVIEEFSTAVCQYCPAGALTISEAIKGRDDVLWIVHHAGFWTDDITIPASSKLTYLYSGGSFAPAVMFDRTTPAEPQYGNSPVLGLPGLQSVDDSEYSEYIEYVTDFIDEMAARDHYTTLYLTGLSYNESNRRLKGMVSGRVFEEFDTANTFLSVYIIEDSIVMSQASTSGYISDYVHMHAVRAAITEDLGSSLDFGADGSYSFTFDNMLPTKIVSSHAKIVALLHGYSRGELDKNAILASGSTRALTSPLLGIDEVAVPQAEVAIYPNPTTDRVSIEAEAAIESLVVFDAAGRIVHRAPSAGGRAYAIDLGGWTAGVYAVRVATANGVATKMIVKQ